MAAAAAGALAAAGLSGGLGIIGDVIQAKIAQEEAERQRAEDDLIRQRSAERQAFQGVSSSVGNQAVLAGQSGGAERQALNNLLGGLARALS